MSLLPAPRQQLGESRNNNIWERPASQPQNLENALAHALETWGQFTEAIVRHEQLVGRPAPAPTDSGRRLSALLVEWMMGLDEGWVTGLDIPRSGQLKALGNGVVPQQAEAALMHLLEGSDLTTMATTTTTTAPTTPAVNTTTTTPHPAKFSTPVLDAIAQVLAAQRFIGVVLDPFAGVGGVHELAGEGVVTVGVELEPEWARQHPMTICGSVLDLGALGFEDGEVDAIVTSPAYGNRMADHHTPSAADTSKRHTYRHYLGRELTDGSSGMMQWGDEYRAFHTEAWVEVLRVLRPGGLFVLNISDHVRKSKVMPVSAWHRATLRGLGVDWLPGDEGRIAVSTRRQRHGANGDLRVVNEWVMVGRKREA